MQYFTFDTRSDDERREAVTLCRTRQPHRWGQWMRALDADSTCRDYRRFCAVCNKEQRGVGTASGLDVVVTR